ncbi:MAG TPA: PIN domain-containing protein [Blastocatellia bacterium]|nr:PIN domain-containing protein [Blastocatellia bacterium]HMV86497.1 PIN domain-containing protein [Blastocatellia bacterium]HMY76774.1 PIN domain-containing protein [Blastocatellia bacterium]HMZ19712.1 PIN domain-containing protein [Blastocatellia bacterium]HNG34777.1 PIN domain-containing protein [Blastocatellia bacterium]
MKTEMFLDTSGLLSLFDKGSAHHGQAADLFAHAQSLMTTNYVLAEFVPLTHVRGLSRSKSLGFLRDLVLLPRLELVWIDERLHRQAMNLLNHRLDKTYSLCDAVSFVLMRERGILEALTTDKHFVQEGFIRLLDL